MKHANNKAAVALGKLGGAASAKVKTEAKREASRANGKNGGRPKKTHAEAVKLGVKKAKVKRL